MPLSNTTWGLRQSLTSRVARRRNSSLGACDLSLGFLKDFGWALWWGGNSHAHAWIVLGVFTLEIGLYASSKLVAMYNKDLPNSFNWSSSSELKWSMRRWRLLHSSPQLQPIVCVHKGDEMDACGAILMWWRSWPMNMMLSWQCPNDCEGHKPKKTEHTCTQNLKAILHWNNKWLCDRR